MAAARNATNSTTTPKNGRGASRLSFAKITDTLEVPDLLALQTESFDWLVANDEWKARVAEAKPSHSVRPGSLMRVLCLKPAIAT